MVPTWKISCSSRVWLTVRWSRRSVADIVPAPVFAPHRLRYWQQLIQYWGTIQCRAVRASDCHAMPKSQLAPVLSSILASFDAKKSEGAADETMGHRPLPAVRDFTRDDRWSVSVLKKRGEGRGRLTDRSPSKATITNKTRPAGSFSSS